MKLPLRVTVLFLMLVSAAPTVHAFSFGFETEEGFAAGPLHGQPSSATTTFAADPALNSSNATNPRFSVVGGEGVGGTRALKMNTAVTRNFEAILIPLQPADYGATSGLPTKLFRIGASVKRSTALGTRFDPDFTFEWGAVEDFRMVKMRASFTGELLVYEANRIMPNVIYNVFAGGASSPFRRIEAVINYPNRTYKLFIDGVAQLGGRDINFASANNPTGQIQVGFSACVLGPNYLIDNFTCAVEPGATDIPAPVPNQPDDSVTLPANSLKRNIVPTTWLPSELDRRARVGGLEINWYISLRQAYPNLPKFKKSDGTEVLRIAEEIVPSNKVLPDHPRLFFPDLPQVPGKTPFQVLQDRAADPAYAQVTDQIKRQGQSALDSVFPPSATHTKMDAEDPGRGQTELLYWLGLAYIIETDAGKKAALQTRLKDWIDWHLDIGNFTGNLPLGQQSAALAVMYDWFYHDFLAQDPVFRKRLKHGVANCVRFRSDMANRTGGGRNPITPPCYNHAWFNNIGPAMAGLALWGDHDADLRAAEIQGWLAEGFATFSMQQGMMPRDGGLFESWSYGDYGNRPVFDFVSQAERLLDLGGQLIDSDHNRNEQDRVFYFSPLLKQDQVMRYGDGFIHADGGASPYHYLANRYRSPRAQLLAQTLMANTPTYWPLFAASPTTGNNYWPTFWRSLFWYDKSLPANSFSDLPLFVNQRNFGIVSARSDWTTSASSIAFRCGPHIGLDAASVWNGTTYLNEHQYPATGNVVFFDGGTEILPSTDWQPVKWSGYYNGPLFVPRDGQLAFNGGIQQSNPPAVTTNTLIGQDPSIDTNVPAVFSKPYTDNTRHPRLIHAVNQSNLNSYLIEFGGKYVLTDSRNTGNANGATKSNRQTTYPTCFRRIVHLPERNVVVVVDQVRTFYGRQPVYNTPTRFLNPVLTTTSPGNGILDFTQLTNCPVKDGRQSVVNYDGRLVFFSPSAGTASLDTTTVPTARDSARQNLRYTITGDVTESAFGFAVGKKANLAGLSFAITGGNLVISGLPGGDQTFPINDDNPLPAEAVEGPVFSPGAAPVATPQAVTITTNTPGATIRYTTDDSAPSSTSGMVYSGPINVTSTTILRAIAYKSGQSDSPITRAVYSFAAPSTPTASTPVFSPTPGSYPGAQSVTINNSTANATIYYTVDGSTPSATNGSTYASAIAVSANTTLKAIAIKSGLADSPIASGTYTIVAASAAAPVFNPGPGTYFNAPSVTISTPTSGASIFFTTDGSPPSATLGTPYTGPISLNTDTTLKAVAIKSGMADSAVTSGIYTLSTATPSSSLAAGSYLGAQTLSLSSMTTGVTLLYTLDGSTPTTSNALTYNGSPISLHAPTLFSATIPVKAVALHPGFGDSPVFSANYTINRKPFTGFESGEGYTAGVSLVSGSQPSTSGATKWTSDSAPAKIFVVDASGGNPGQTITSGNFTISDFVGSKSARISPSLSDLGASSPLGQVVMRYDLRLNFSPSSNTNAAHTVIGPRDTTGTNQGRVTQIAIRNNGNLAYNTGASANLLAKKADGSTLALAQNQWVSVVYIMDFASRTWILEIDGVRQKDASGSTNLTFQSTGITGNGADEFGSFSLSVPGSFADWGSISLDNLDFFVPTYRAPTAFTAIAASASGIDLDWSDPAPDETGYILESSSNAGSSWSTLATLPPNITSYSLTGLPAGSARSFRLRATYATGTSAPISTSSTTLTPPAPPTNLLGSVTDTTASLSWSAVGGATSYSVKHSAIPGGPYSLLASDVDIEHYSDSELSPGTPSFYVVSATGPGGESANSAEIALTTLTSLQQWRHDNFGITANSGLAADSADPDADGLPNLLAYALGVNPSTPPAMKHPVIGTVVVSGQLRLSLSFNRISDPSLTYRIWASSDLQNWGTSPIWSSTGSENIEGPFLFTDPLDISTFPRRFLRLEVTTP